MSISARIGHTKADIINHFRMPISADILVDAAENNLRTDDVHYGYTPVNS